MQRFSIIAAIAFLALSACGSKSATIPEKDVCVRAGCSQQLCVPRAQANTPSSCEWREDYACYGIFGRCGVQPDGSCGWFNTPDLRACLANPSAYTGNKMRQQLTPRPDPYIERIRPDDVNR